MQDHCIPKATEVSAISESKISVLIYALQQLQYILDHLGHRFDDSKNRQPAHQNLDEQTQTILLHGLALEIHSGFPQINTLIWWLKTWIGNHLTISKHYI